MRYISDIASDLKDVVIYAIGMGIVTFVLVSAAMLTHSFIHILLRIAGVM